MDGQQARGILVQSFWIFVEIRPKKRLLFIFFACADAIQFAN